LKKTLILLTLFFLFLTGCNDDLNTVYEPMVTNDSIVFPFESKDNGRFASIYRNHTDKSIPITFSMVKSGEVLEGSQDYDFCPDILKFREGVITSDWFIINLNFPITADSEVPNQNDHPNLISYSLPLGTYIVFLMEKDTCTADQYEIFDITTNDGLT